MPAKRPDRVGNQRTAFERNRLIILKTQAICGICGLPVDKTLRSPHPLSATVDHIIPVAKGGNPSALDNLQLAHRVCNRAKSDKLLVDANVRSTKSKEAKNKGKSNGFPQHFNWMEYRPNADMID